MNCQSSSSDAAMCRDARLGTSPALAKPHHILHRENSIRPTKTKPLTKWVFIILAHAMADAVFLRTLRGRPLHVSRHCRRSQRAECNAPKTGGPHSRPTVPLAAPESRRSTSDRRSEVLRGDSGEAQVGLRKQERAAGDAIPPIPRRQKNTPPII